MIERLGVVLYWARTVFGIVFGGFGVLALFGETPTASLLLFVPAAIAWGAGWVLRYILTGE